MILINVKQRKNLCLHQKELPEVEGKIAMVMLAEGDA
jgi:hypothetical protein